MSSVVCLGSLGKLEKIFIRISYGAATVLLSLLAAWAAVYFSALRSAPQADFRLSVRLLGKFSEK